MDHIHSMDAIHRDMKSSNCLVTSLAENAEINVKIGMNYTIYFNFSFISILLGDFGLSRFISRSREGHTAKMTQGQIGTSKKKKFKHYKHQNFHNFK